MSHCYTLVNGPSSRKYIKVHSLQAAICTCIDSFLFCSFVFCNWCLTQFINTGLVQSAQHYHHPGGPGLGVRLNSGWQPPKMTPIRFGPPVTSDREAVKLEKFRTLLKEPNLNLGKYTYKV